MELKKAADNMLRALCSVSCHLLLLWPHV